MKNTTVTRTMNTARQAFQRAVASPAALRERLREEEGATAAEYAVTVLAACAFAAVLFGVLTSGPIRQLVIGLITSALGSAG